MRTLLLSICMFICIGTATAEEVDSNSTSICPGNWVLSKPSGWVVRNDEGLILPITAGTEVLGCGKASIPLSEDLSGVSVNITCAPSAIKNGLPDLVSLTIVCE